MSTQVVASNAVMARKMFDAFKQGDISYILNQLDDDCQWNVMGAPSLPFAPALTPAGFHPRSAASPRTQCRGRE